jgi:hypothetical protein
MELDWNGGGAHQRLDRTPGTDDARWFVGRFVGRSVRIRPSTGNHVWMNFTSKTLSLGSGPMYPYICFAQVFVIFSWCYDKFFIFRFHVLPERGHDLL